MKVVNWEYMCVSPLELVSWLRDPHGCYTLRGASIPSCSFSSRLGVAHGNHGVLMRSKAQHKITLHTTTTTTTTTTKATKTRKTRRTKKKKNCPNQSLRPPQPNQPASTNPLTRPNQSVRTNETPPISETFQCGSFRTNNVRSQHSARSHPDHVTPDHRDL